jgi:thymidylate synthase (FAD)
MKILTYDDIIIDVLAKTDNSVAIIGLACNVTQKGNLVEWNFGEFLPNKGAIEFLIRAGHTSVLEHNLLCFQVRNVSRSLLQQLARQRHFSLTSSSQHYQNHKDYPVVLDPDWNSKSETEKAFAKSLEASFESYRALIKLGVNKAEARQVLPNACAVSIIISSNARELINFFGQRLCKRNTKEMQTFANKLLVVCKGIFPDVFTGIDLPCKMAGFCSQGTMSCGKAVL